MEITATFGRDNEDNGKHEHVEESCFFGGRNQSMNDELLVWVLQGLKFKDGFAPHPTIFSQHKGFFEVSKKGTSNKRGF